MGSDEHTLRRPRRRPTGPAYRKDLVAERAFVNSHLDKANYADFVNAVDTGGVMSTNTLITDGLLKSPVLTPSAEVRGRISFHDVLGDAQELWRSTWDAFKAA